MVMYDYLGFDSEGYNSRGYNMAGYNREGFNEEGYDPNGIDALGISKRTGDKDSKVALAEEFIASGLTLEAFCEDEKKKIEVVTKSFEALKQSPCIRDELAAALEKSKEKPSEEDKEIKEKVLSGEMPIKSVSEIYKVLRICSTEERQQVRELLITAIDSHELKIMEYKNIFGIKEENDTLPIKIIAKISGLTKYVRRSKNQRIKMMIKGLDNEVRRITAYKSPFKPADLKRIGYEEKGKVKYLTITQEMIENAEKYLRAKGEFVCFKTMNDLFMSVVKGTLSEHQLKMVDQKKDKKKEEKKEDKKEEPER